MWLKEEGAREKNEPRKIATKDTPRKMKRSM